MIAVYFSVNSNEIIKIPILAVCFVERDKLVKDKVMFGNYFYLIFTGTLFSRKNLKKKKKKIIIIIKQFYFVFKVSNTFGPFGKLRENNSFPIT